LRGERGSNTPDLPDQVIEGKQKFISQIMTSKSPVRSCEDVDETALTYGEIKALATGNPLIKEKMTLDMEVSRLKLAKSAYSSEIYRLEDNISMNYPTRIASLSEKIKGYEADIAAYQEKKPKDKESFLMTVGEKAYLDKKQAGEAIIALCAQAVTTKSSVRIGNYLGFSMRAAFDSFDKQFILTLKGEVVHSVALGADPLGNVTRINNALEGMQGKLEGFHAELAEAEKNLKEAKEAVKKPFPKEQELAEKLARLSELDRMLDLDKTSNAGTRESDMEAAWHICGKASNAVTQESNLEAVRNMDGEANTSVTQESEKSVTLGVAPISSGNYPDNKPVQTNPWDGTQGLETVEKISLAQKPLPMGLTNRTDQQPERQKSAETGLRPSVRMKLALFKQQLSQSRQPMFCEERGQSYEKDRPSL
ncbi:MAG: hypothetical protein IJU50_04780, partial [Lachnospiraceae bacterium]|nr:hypothetical protein [Lachnospiraceae bacterium]